LLLFAWLTMVTVMPAVYCSPACTVKLFEPVPIAVLVVEVDTKAPAIAAADAAEAAALAALLAEFVALVLEFAALVAALLALLAALVALVAALVSEVATADAVLLACAAQVLISVGKPCSAMTKFAAVVLN
jgi:hypothetical protein